MARNKQQSAINEMRDQLFLDTADSVRLNVVTSNLGLDRPTTGLDDDEWRAVSKNVALQSKQVLPIFHRIMEACIGPRKTKIARLSAAGVIGDTIIQSEDASDLLQLGKLVLSPGLPAEETIDFCFRDIETNKIFLSAPLTNTHAIVAAASGNLLTSIIVGATTIPMFDTSTFPTTGFPYLVMLEKGGDNEEVVQISANDTALNQLTCSATAKAHAGSKSTFIRKALDLAAPVGRDFIQLDSNAARSFPQKGAIRLNFGGANEETRFYTEVQLTTNVLFLKRPLVNTHLVNESVELVTPGISVETISMLQQGKDWSIHQTQARKVKAVLPQSLVDLRLLDASWFHDVSIPVVSTSLVEPTLVTTTELQITSPTGFPDEAGVLLVNGTIPAFYLRRYESATTTLASATLIGATIITGINTFGFPEKDFKVILDQGGAAQETVDVLQHTNEGPNGILILVAGTVNAHAIGEGIDLLNSVLKLSEQIGTALIVGATVALVPHPYVGTDLEEGNLRTALGALDPEKFPGPYVYDVTQRSPSLVTTTLATAITPPTRVANSQSAGNTTLEVEDAQLWPAPAFTPFLVRIGRNSGFFEDRTITDRTLALGLSTTVNALVGAGVSSFTGADTTGFPQSNGSNPAGYRIVIDKGGANEETITVNQNTAGTPGTFTVRIDATHPTGLTNLPHTLGESIALVNDVLTFDALTQPHAGPLVTPTSAGVAVEPLISQLAVTAGGALPDTGGTVLLNFGQEQVSVRAKIAVVVSTTILAFADTSSFLTTGNPYRIVVGQGLPTEEFAFVIANDTVLDRLTLQTPLVGSFSPGDYVEFTASVPTRVDYVDRDTNTLDLALPTVFPSGYSVGESVMLSLQESVPSPGGTDYAFLLPPDDSGCLTLLFDLVRAAGIEIEFLADR